MNYRRAIYAGALILGIAAAAGVVALANPIGDNMSRWRSIGQSSQAANTKSLPTADTSKPKSLRPAKMPDTTNTGVPPGTALSEYSGPMAIDTPNTVIDGKVIHGALLIRAKNVKIARSQIIGTVSNDSDGADSSFTISDSFVDAGGDLVTGIGSRNFTATRVHVIGGNRSIFCSRNCVVEYSYVHGQTADESGKAHESGIRMSQGSTIRFNTIGCDAPDIPPDAGCSAALTGYGDFEPVKNNLIEGNVFVYGSGGFCAYGGSSGADGAKPFGAQAGNIRFINNVWQRGTSPGDKGVPVCGHWGPITDFDSSRPGNVWSGNKWDDGTQVDP
jgi:hypothetical protein